MYRICKCEDFPCCGHGFGEEMTVDEYLDMMFDPFMDEFEEDEE